MISFLVIFRSTGSDSGFTSAKVRAADIDDAASIAINSLCIGEHSDRFLVAVVEEDYAADVQGYLRFEAFVA